MNRWDGFEFFQLLRAPRPPDHRNGADPTPSHLFAALTAAHVSLTADSPSNGDGSALVVAWLRSPGANQMSFLVGGRPFFPPASGDGALGQENVSILYPPGSAGRRLPDGLVSRMFNSLPHWVACAGQSDSLWLPGQDGQDNSLRGSFDDYAAHLHSAFSWLVIAEPLSTQVVDNELDRLAIRLPQMRKKENSEQDRLDLRRAEARYRELTKARMVGLWQIRLLVGGETAPLARSAAAVLCSASELHNAPYVLTPGDVTSSLDQTVQASVQTRDGSRAPFMASSELLLALARPPARELPGIQLVTPHRFDVTPETASSDGFWLGDVLDEAYHSAGAFTVPRATLNRHAFICGATGSGKSQTTRMLLEQLSRNAEPVPWLVIEPAKAEYARMAGRLAEASNVTVIRPGDPNVAPACLNPLEPEAGFPLQSHADLIRALFLAAFEANEPFPQVLSRALTQVYIDAGWNLVTGQPRPAIKPKFHTDEPDEPVVGRYPTLGELQRTAQDIVERIGYGKEITADVRGFVDVRIGSLREGAPGRFFEGGHPLDISQLLNQNVVFELEDITNDQDKAFLIGAVLIRIVEHLRIRHAKDNIAGLRHVTVVEEAHRLLKNVSDGPAAAAVELFASLLAEIRAYGEGVIVIEQIPTKILPDVLKNSALKIMHRLPAADDREKVGATMNLQPNQSELVVSLPPGIAAATVDGMDRPILLRMPTREDAEDQTLTLKQPPLKRPRSSLCGVDCHKQPCTLRMIDAAEHHSREPLIILWIEAIVTSYIIGQPPPSPSTNLQHKLVASATERLNCTLVHAVQRAITARRSWLTPWLDPADLASHVISVARELATGGNISEERNWLRWTAGMYRWQNIRFELNQAISHGKSENGPHPLTDYWAKLGLHLRGATIAEQLASLKAHPSYLDGQEQVTLGDLQVSQLRRAIRQVTGATTKNCVQRALQAACSGPSLQMIIEQTAHLIADDPQFLAESS